MRQHLSLSIDEGLLDAFSDWAVRANAIVFLPDGSIRDPRGRILLSAAGEAGVRYYIVEHDNAAEYPGGALASVRTSYGNLRRILA